MKYSTINCPHCFLFTKTKSLHHSDRVGTFCCPQESRQMKREREFEKERRGEERRNGRGMSVRKEPAGENGWKRWDMRQKRRRQLVAGGRHRLQFVVF